MIITKDNILTETLRGNPLVLDSPLVGEVVGTLTQGLWSNMIVDRHETPLHLLARKGITKVLSSPLVGELPNLFGDTPLHLFCESCYTHDRKGATTHPAFLRIRNLEYETPAHKLALRDNLFKDDLIRLCPWFDFDKIKGVRVSYKQLSEILNSSNAERFIFSVNR